MMDLNDFILGMELDQPELHGTSPGQHSISKGGTGSVHTSWLPLLGQ